MTTVLIALYLLTGLAAVVLSVHRWVTDGARSSGYEGMSHFGLALVVFGSMLPNDHFADQWQAFSAWLGYFILLSGCWTFWRRRLATSRESSS